MHIHKLMFEDKAEAGITVGHSVRDVVDSRERENRD